MFPLPLSEFEHYMYADDRVTSPMTAFMRYRFTGRLERSGFEHAFQAALVLHPLLRATIVGRPEWRRSRLRWVESAVAPELNWVPEGEEPRFRESMFIDLQRAPGTRLWVRDRSDQSEIITQLHHACADGLGSLHFVETLLLAYHAQRSGEDPLSAASVRMDQLASRGMRRLRTWEQVRRIHKGLFRIARYYRSSPQPMAAQWVRPANVSCPFPPILTAWLEPEETRSVRKAAHQAGATVNSFLLRELLLTLDDWNRRHGRGSRPLRIVVPVNLREENGLMPACNSVSMSFVDRSPAQLVDPHELLRNIVAELDETKNLRRGMALLPIVRLLGMIPGGLKSQLRSDRCLGTTVFSNLGIPFDRSPLQGPDGRLTAGEVTLESVEAAPPTRPLTHTTFVVHCYAGRLGITLRYDPDALREEDADSLLDDFFRRVRESIDVSLAEEAVV
ncbi:MAG TPA: hypothetical protein VHB77_12980 [Planctomycetaceae bacterium]|nr:hypothetical protein [Planctomycetaceae bacterium]